MRSLSVEDILRRQMDRLIDKQIDRYTAGEVFWDNRLCFTFNVIVGCHRCLFPLILKTTIIDITLLWQTYN